MGNPVEAYLLRMIDIGASDVFLRADESPTFRVNGELVEVEMPALSEQQMRSCIDGLLTPVAAERFQQSPDTDVAYVISGKARYRINVFMHQGRLGLVARLIPSGAVQFKSLNLPSGVLKWAEKRSGLILVVGPTGCGKSTTLASLLHHINASRRVHIVTIEDPIEFVHEQDRALIHQRQVGFDTRDFATALRHVVRQSPDVILIGEMRDRDTMETALNAALTGHLILTTMHTTSVVQSVDRMLNYFPGEARGQAQADLAATLVGMMSMRLLPRADGAGRIPATEVLIATSTVRRMVTEGDFVGLYDTMKRGRDIGMMTLNQSLVDLTKRRLVDEADALPHSPNPEEFRLNMQGMFTGVESIDMRTSLKDELAEEGR